MCYIYYVYFNFRRRKYYENEETFAVFFDGADAGVLAVCPYARRSVQSSGPVGVGTQSDPYVVATYDELRERFSAVGEKWIKLGSDIVSKDHNNLYNLSVSNTVHLDLAGHKIERKSGMTYDKELIYVGTGSTLIIDDSGTGGKIIADMPHSFYSCITVYGTLTVNGGTFSTADNYNLYDSTDGVYKQYVDVINTNDANAEVTVYDGTVDEEKVL